MAVDDIPEHAENSPSSTEGWATCADYINANRGLPDDESEFAREGTIAHEISDNCLTFGFDPFDFVGMQTRHNGWFFTWEEDDAAYLQPGIDWVREQPGTFFGEHRVDLTEWVGKDSHGRRQFGTLDRGVVSDKLIVISDLKYGRGLAVSPVENKQLRLYALGFWKNVARHHSDATEFLIQIDQPRNASGGGEWRTNLSDLLAFGEWIKERAEATRAPHPPRTASEKGCYWCRRRKQPPTEQGAVSGCKTYDAFNLAMLEAEFDDLDGCEFDELILPGHNRLTDERRAFLLRHRSMIEKWLDGIHADVLSTAQATGNAGGLKAVAGKPGRRVWLDAGAAEKAIVPLLGAKSFTQKLITPTQCGKAISKEDYERFVGQHVDRAAPKPILVPIEDERPALLTVDEFEDLD